MVNESARGNSTSNGNLARGQAGSQGLLVVSPKDNSGLRVALALA